MDRLSARFQRLVHRLEATARRSFHRTPQQRDEQSTEGLALHEAGSTVSRMQLEDVFAIEDLWQQEPAQPS